MTYHIPVLAEESVDGLNIQPNGIYVDATFGGGGHSRIILSKINNGILAAFDRDADAIHNIPNDERIIFFPNNYRFIKNFLEYKDLSPVDGILADLGVSSHQFDQATRGFSFRFEGPLDLRMNNKAGQTAADIINNYSERDLIHLFSAYGEIKNSRTLTKLILETRAQKPIETTTELANAVDKITSPHIRNKYLAQIFQALRIEVNQELDSLKEFLTQTPEILKPGGRLVIISYHSLEDRLVKNFMKSGNFEGKETKDFFGNTLSPFKLISRKAIQAQEAEISVNNRARSARLRIAERI